MVNTFWGIKIGQSQTFDDNGNRIPVSIIDVKPMVVIGLLSKDKDGHSGYRIAIGERRIKTTKKPIIGQVRKAGLTKGPRFLREIRDNGESANFAVGKAITIDNVFKKNDIVAVTGVSKGKGFAGVVKRWGFAGGPKTHGQSDRERAPGSIGQTTTPGRVYKGKKMAGRMGGGQKTVSGLKVAMVDENTNKIEIKGLIPGFKGGLVMVRLLTKAKVKKDIK